jgi:ABC-2 type transport system ATP-binding protein/lipopolysaccharide transport system ATP-binding protein
MLARLGFSVATDIEPDILVVDEVLAVGDEAFQAKSKSRFRSMIEKGTTVVLVSHDLDAVLDLASRVVWLDHGIAKMIAEPKVVVDAYRESV